MVPTTEASNGHSNLCDTVGGPVIDSPELKLARALDKQYILQIQIIEDQARNCVRPTEDSTLRLLKSGGFTQCI